MKTEKTEILNRTNETKTCEIVLNQDSEHLIYVDGELQWFCETDEDVVAQITSCFENGYFDITTEISIVNDPSPIRDYAIYVNGNLTNLLVKSTLYRAQLYGYIEFGQYGVTFEIFEHKTE